MERKPIYYKYNPNNSYYKIIIDENAPSDDMDTFLDMLSSDGSEFTTEEEFEARYDRVMELDIYDSTESYIIGTLVTEWLDLEDVEEEIIL